MKEIKSSKNEMIKEVKKLHKKKNREAKKQYIIEGFHLIEEAIKAEAPIKWIFLSKKREDLKQNFEKKEKNKLILLNDTVFQTISELPTTQGILAVVEMEEEKQELIFEGSWLLLDNVQDPGNVGTMIRTADAAGFTGVIIGEGTADIYGTKVLRSMQGSNFHLPIIRKNLLSVVDALLEAKLPVYGTEINTEAISYDTLPKSTSFGLVMGNEGQGVSKKILEKTTNVYIPIRGQAESLNVAIAAAILMYQLK